MLLSCTPQQVVFKRISLTKEFSTQKAHDGLFVFETSYYGSCEMCKGAMVLRLLYHMHPFMRVPNRLSPISGIFFILNKHFSQKNLNKK
jgi:hypothetical protein